MKSNRIQSRRGVVLPFVALLLLALFAMVAFAIDIGRIALVKSELQAIADSSSLAAASELYSGRAAATAEAERYASLNRAGGQFGLLGNGDVEFGFWDNQNRAFNLNGSPTNAVRVTARRGSLPMTFGVILGKQAQDVLASAVAAVTPADIAFVIDLSGSMNNDTEIWATRAINNAFPEYSGIGDQLVANVFEDFGYGSFPGTLAHVGRGMVPSNNFSYANLTSNTGPLTAPSVPAQYRIQIGDGELTRKSKAYRWIIDNQLGGRTGVLRNADPVPDSSVSFDYYSQYLDYIIRPQRVFLRGWLPPRQNSFRLSGGGNPYTPAWPDLNTSAYTSFYNQLGYLTYVQFMMDYGWNKDVISGVKVPLSILSPDVPLKLDTDPTSPGNGFRFPPREQPTHAVRLAVMAGIQRISEINGSAPGPIKDHVAVISYDFDARVRFPLNIADCDYLQAKSSVTDMQAVADDTASTAGENGLELTRRHLDSSMNPGGARSSASKLVIFLTDGIPNLKQTNNGVIDAFIADNPDGEWFTGGRNQYERNAMLMQTALMRALGWKVYGVGVGLGADRDLMDRMARMAGTGVPNPDDPDGPLISPYAGGNPANYQVRVTEIFNDIISKNLQLVR